MNQLPGLCDTCAYRALVAYINPEQDAETTEQTLLFFCKAPTLNQFNLQLPIYQSNNDTNGVVSVVSGVTNCTEYRPNGIVTITGASYTPTTLTVNYTIQGLTGTDTLLIYQFGNSTPLGTFTGESNTLTGSHTISGAIADGTYGVYGILQASTYQSNIYPLVVDENPAPIIIIDNIYYDCTGTTPTVMVDWTIMNLSGTDTVQIWVNGVDTDNFGSQSNGSTTGNILGSPTTNGVYSMYAKLLTSGVTSAVWPVTLSCVSSGPGP